MQMFWYQQLRQEELIKNWMEALDKRFKVQIDKTKIMVVGKMGENV